MWNTIMMDKALCMSMDGCYGRNMKSREGKIHTQNMSIPWRTDLCLFHDGRDPLISLSHGVWLIPPKEWFHQELKVDVCSCQVLSSITQVNIGKRKSILPSLCEASVSATLFTGSVSDCLGGWKKRLTDTHRVCNFVQQVIKSLLCSGCTFGGLHMRHKYFQSPWSLWKLNPHNSSLDCLVTNF